jgi:hypothetical protein
VALLAVWVCTKSKPPYPTANTIGSADQGEVRPRGSQEGDGDLGGPAAPTRTRVDLAPARILVENEEGAPVVGATVCAHDTDARSPDQRERLAESGADGVARPALVTSRDLVITALGYAEHRLTVGPRADLRVVLQRVHDLRIVCMDLNKLPLAGVLVAVSPRALSPDWLSERVSQQATDVPLAPAKRAVTGKDEPYVATTDTTGVAEFVALPRFDVRWQVYSTTHALVGGAGISNEERIAVPGRYEFRLAPLIAAGFIIEGDRFAGVRKLDMPGANLLPTDRGGATHRARRELQARFPDTAFLEVMAARDMTALGNFVVDVMLARTGPRAITVEWLPLDAFRTRGPQRVAIDPSIGAAKSPFVGRVLIRLQNPDGEELKGRRMLLSGPNGCFEVLTGVLLEASIGTYRVTARHDPVAGYLQRPLTVDIAASGTEVIWSLQVPMRLVRFFIPADTEGTPILNVTNDQGGRTTMYMRSGDRFADLLLPEKPLSAAINSKSGWGPASRFVPQSSSDPQIPYMAVQLQN